MKKTYDIFQYVQNIDKKDKKELERSLYKI